MLGVAPQVRERRMAVAGHALQPAECQQSVEGVTVRRLRCIQMP